MEEKLMTVRVKRSDILKDISGLIAVLDRNEKIEIRKGSNSEFFIYVVTE